MNDANTGTGTAVLTENRIVLLKRSVEAMMDAGLRKTTFYPLIAESLKETLGEPQQIRRAKAFAHLLDQVALEVHPQELLGGSISGMWPVDPNPPSYEEQYAEAEAVIEEEVNPTKPREEKPGMFPGMRAAPFRFALMARDHYDANCDYRRLQTIIKHLQRKYEGSDKIADNDIARILEFHFNYDYGEEAMGLIRELPWMAANHIGLNYGKVVRLGFDKILADIEARAASETDGEKREFYEAAALCYRAVIRYIRRYAQAYRDAAKTEGDPRRKAELEDIAARLDRNAGEKPASFRDALQLTWITHIIANTQMGSALSFGRMDQYLFPFYDKDIAEGRIDDDQVEELLACMMMKVNEPKMRTVQSCILGGTTPEGKNGVTGLTRAFLRASRMVKTPYPNLVLRVSKELTPEWAYDEAIETIKCGHGMPMLVNDDVWVPNFIALGHTPEDARNFYNMGCVEMLIANKHAGWGATAKYFVLYPDMLWDLLHAHQKGETRFETFEDLYRTMLERIKTEIRSLKLEPGFKSFMSRGCDAFGSILIDGCFESGKDMYRGGPELASHLATSGQGLATTVDSLSTIKTLVFDQKKLTLDELINITENNFKGEEALRQYILNAVPHYGNDIEWVDAMAEEMFRTFTGEIFKLNDGTIPEKYVSSYFSYTNHVGLGEITPATPDGRLKGMPLSDNLGPSQGRDTEGPTKFMNSLLKLDYKHLNGALATNIKVNPNLFSTGGGTRALKHLLLSFLQDGGPQVQVNFVSKEDLLDAQVDPMKHRDIVVRIAGFCEYFIYLDAKQQDEVIARTEHSA
jgi:formate C-acetyltransferase